MFSFFKYSRRFVQRISLRIELTWVDVFQLICLDFLGWDWLVVLVFGCISIYISIDVTTERERDQEKEANRRRRNERMHQSLSFSDWSLIIGEKRRNGCRRERKREWAMIRQSRNVMSPSLIRKIGLLRLIRSRNDPWTMNKYAVCETWRFYWINRFKWSKNTHRRRLDICLSRLTSSCSKWRYSIDRSIVCLTSSSVERYEFLLDRSPC